ncbi:nucleotidyl transferase AbiEii/AbiGii toxin family protein [Bacteroidota bacterium]
MPSELKWKTVSESLAEILKKIMLLDEFSDFRLVGGTGLSLQLGHRKSDDIDLFTDLEYGSVDFHEVDRVLNANFDFVSDDLIKDLSFGIMRYVGLSKDDSLKLDIFYSDPFIREAINIEGIRLAAVEDIAAMKLDVIAIGGRKRDFWDIHELLELFSLEDLFGLYMERNPYLDTDDLINGLTNFSNADQQDDPVCFKGKFWELIKIDLEEVVDTFNKG